MAAKPLVSVILPTRDRGCLVSRALDSVLAQTHDRLEILVVDDGSRDDTARVLRRFGERITVFSQRSAGPYVARNHALRHASGEYIAFIDDDDLWCPDRVESQLRLMERPEVGLVFGDALHVRAGDRVRWRTTCFLVSPPRRGRVAGDLAWANFVPTSTVLVRRSCLEDVTGFPTSHLVSADYLTWFRIALRHEFDYVPRVLAHYTVHEGSSSYDLGVALQARIELFAAERARTADPEVQRLIERVLTNLGLYLAIATVRGRAPNIEHPWSLMRTAITSASAREVVRSHVELLARRSSSAVRRTAARFVSSPAA